MTTKPPGRWSFLPSLLLFATFCAAALASVLLVMDLPLRLRHGAMVLYFLLITGALHAWQESASIDAGNVFVRRFMAGLVIKMMVSLGLLLVVVIRLPRAEVVAFTLPFMMLYLAFLGYSTVRLSSRLRKPGGS